MGKELKEEGIKIDSYNLEILMKKYDLIKKGGKAADAKATEIRKAEKNA